MSKRLCLLLALCLIGLRAAGAEVFFHAPPDHWYQSPLLRITAFSAGQSDCMLIECGGEAMMLDGGSEAYADELMAALEEMGVERFRALLGSHYHEDHIGGLCALMEAGWETDVYLHPYARGNIYANPNHRRAMSVVKQKDVPERQIENGDSMLLGGAEITFIRYEDGASANGRSVLAHVRYGGTAALLTADIIGDTQSWCLANVDPALLNVDLLKAPHHGVSAMVKDFVYACSPQAIFINNEEKAAREGIRQAADMGIPAVLTGDGRVVMETDGTDWYIRQLKGIF